MDGIRTFFFLWAGFVQSGICGLHSGHFSYLEEVGSVSISHKLIHHDRVRRSADPDEGPREIHTHVTGESHDVTLRFQAVYGQRLRPLIYTNDNGDILEHVSDKSNCTKFYEDIRSGAHALVDVCDGFTMMAELYLDGAHHVILPKEGATDAEADAAHCLYAVNSTIDYLDDVVKNPEEEANKEENENDLTQSEDPKIRTKREATGSYLVELQLVIDFPLYDSWYQKTPSSLSAAERETEALNSIQSYYAFISRAMNFRFKRTAAHALNIGVELSQIYVLKTLGQSAITAGDDYKSGVRNVIDGNVTLYSFMAWVADKRSSEDGFLHTDHHMLLTGQNMALYGNSAAAGFATWKKICTIQACSVVEGQFDFMMAVIGAHELGHSLAGDHDGDGNPCSSSDSYVLASTNVVRRDANKDSPFQFSSCSVTSFKSTIAELDASGNNCLLTDDIQPIITADGKPPGQVYSPDEQCARVLGTGASMWRYNNYDTTNQNFYQMCYGLSCVKSNFKGELILPADGTKCGNGRWCQNGQCNASSSAEAGNDECLFGDQTSGLTANATCTSVLDTYLAKCYDPVIRIQCCAMCNDRKFDIPDCIYGDTSDCSNITNYHCYQSDVVTKCCKTCHDYKKNIPNCPYGDRSGGCKPQVCRTHAEQCCATCYTGGQPQTTTPAPVTQPPVTTSTEKSQLPDWVIPASGGVGGLVVLSLIGFLIYYLCKQSRSHSRKNSHSSRRSRDRRHSSGRKTRGRRTSGDRTGYYNRGYSRY